MPLTSKGRKVMRELKDEYGEAVFYSMVNSGKLKGVEEKRKGKKA